MLGTPDHPEREQMLELVGEAFDPEKYAVVDSNILLQQMKDKLIPKKLSAVSRGKKSTEGTAPKTVKLTKTTLNKHLKQLSHEQLIMLVKDCFEVSKEMEKYLSVRILGEPAAEALFQEYRKKIENQFYPDRGEPKLRLQEAKKAISEFEKLTGSMKHVFQLKLIYVELGVSFTVDYGDIDERFYNSMVSVYSDIIDHVNDDEEGVLYEEYKDRLAKIVSDTSGIGWGFHDELAYLHAEIAWD